VLKYVKLLREHFRGKSVFSIRDVRIFFAKNGLGKQYSQLLLHNLVESGELFRVTKGVYSFQDDLSVAGFAFSPFYYGLQDALSLMGFWEQETNPVVITPRKVRSGLRKMMGGNVLVRRISRKMFFGFEMLKHGSLWLPVSCPEKTLIDFVYFGEHLPKNALEKLLEKSDEKRLRQFLEKTPKKTSTKVQQLLAGQ